VATKQQVDGIQRLCAMLCLLADDPEVITPDVLADDRYAAGQYNYSSRSWATSNWMVSPMTRRRCGNLKRMIESGMGPAVGQVLRPPE